MIKAVIFDMDGTMLDTEKIKDKGLIYAGECLNIKIDKKIFDEIRGTNNKRLKEILCKKFNGLDFEKLLNIREKYVEEYFLENRIEKKKGLLELLEYLKNNNYKIAVASSSNIGIIKEYLEKVEVLEYFDVIIGGDSVTKGKPDPEIFLKCSEKLGVVKEECLGVEDSSNGILSIHRAGMKPILIPDLEKHSEEIEKLAYAKLEDLSQIIPVLENLNKRESRI